MREKDFVMSSTYGLGKFVARRLPEITKSLYGKPWKVEIRRGGQTNAYEYMIIDETGKVRTDWMTPVDLALWWDGFSICAEEMFS